MDLQGLLKTALVDNDRTRARSVQTELGASSVGGCKRQAWSIIHGKPKVNKDTESLAAIIGTAVHETIAKSVAEADPFGDDFMIEEGFSTPDLKGHIDLYIKSAKQVVDWKTITIKKLGYFPSTQQKMQVQLYGYLLEENGYPVETVSLVGICRDGRMADTKVWQAPYDRAVALKGIEWVRELQATNVPPAPERPANFCRDFCEFYDREGIDGCPGK